MNVEEAFTMNELAIRHRRNEPDPQDSAILDKRCPNGHQNVKRIALESEPLLPAPLILQDETVMHGLC